MVAAVSSVVPGRVRRDRRVDRLEVGRARAPARTSTSSPRRPPRRSKVVGGADAQQGDHHPEPGRAADDHAQHRLLLDPAEAAEAGRAAGRDRRIDQRDGRPGARVRPGLLAQGRTAVRPARATSGTAWPGSRCSCRSAAGATTCPTTPATSTSSPRPRRASARSSPSTEPPPLTSTRRRCAVTTIEQPAEGPHHRLDAARRQPRDAPPVHRGPGARHRLRPRLGRRAGHRGRPRRRSRRLRRSTTASPAPTSSR